MRTMGCPWLIVLIVASGCGEIGDSGPVDPGDEVPGPVFAVSMLTPGFEDAAFVGCVFRVR